MGAGNLNGPGPDGGCKLLKGLDPLASETGGLVGYWCEGEFDVVFVVSIASPDMLVFGL